MLVSQIIKTKGDRVISVHPEQTILEAADILKKERIGAIVVRDSDGALAGILSERDVARSLPVHGAALQDKLVKELMTKSVVTCTTHSHIDDITKEMSENRIRHLPVVEDGKILGIISIGDVVKCRLEELENEANMLQEYIRA